MMPKRFLAAPIVDLPQPVSRAAWASVTDAGMPEMRFSSRAMGPNIERNLLGSSLPPGYFSSSESAAAYWAFCASVCFDESVLEASVLGFSVLGASALGAEPP